MCFKGTDFASIFTIFRLYFGIVPKVWYALVFIIFRFRSYCISMFLFFVGGYLRDRCLAILLYIVFRCPSIRMVFLSPFTCNCIVARFDMKNHFPADLLRYVLSFIESNLFSVDGNSYFSSYYHQH